MVCVSGLLPVTVQNSDVFPMLLGEKYYLLFKTVYTGSNSHLKSVSGNGVLQMAVESI